MKKLYYSACLAVVTILCGGCNNDAAKNTDSTSSVQEALPESADNKTDAKSPTPSTMETNEPLNVPETAPETIVREIEGVDRPNFTVTSDSEACSKIEFSSDIDISNMEIAMQLGTYTLYAEPMTLVCDTPFLLRGSCAITNSKPFRVKTEAEDFIFRKIKAGSISFSFDEDGMSCKVIKRQ